MFLSTVRSYLGFHYCLHTAGTVAVSILCCVLALVPASKEKEMLTSLLPVISMVSVRSMFTALQAIGHRYWLRSCLHFIRYTQKQ